MLILLLSTIIYAQDSKLVTKQVIKAGMSFEQPRIIKKNVERKLIKFFNVEDKIWVPIAGGIAKSGIDQEINTKNFYKLQFKSNDVKIIPEAIWKLNDDEGIVKFNLNWGF